MITVTTKRHADVEIILATPGDDTIQVTFTFPGGGSRQTLLTVGDAEKLSQELAQVVQTFKSEVVNVVRNS